LLLRRHEVDELAGQLAVAVWEMLSGRRGQLVDALRPTRAMGLGRPHRGQTVSLQGLEVVQGALLRDFEMRCNLA